MEYPYLLTCRARRSFPTLDLNQRAVSAGTAEHLRGDCSSISFGIPRIIVLARGFLHAISSL